MRFVETVGKVNGSNNGKDVIISECLMIEGDINGVSSKIKFTWFIKQQRL